MARKTYPVQDLVERLNLALRIPECDMGASERRSVSEFVEGILHQTGNYHGFGYQDSEFAAEPPFHPGTTHLRPGYDDTRRVYYQR